MKLSAGAAEGFLEKPDLSLLGALVYGPDAGMVAMARRALVAAVAEGDDLRLTQMDGALAAKDIAELDTALRARGFFPGRRVVVVEGGKDGLAKELGPLLDELNVEDAFLVVTAGQLAARSALRKLFEGHRGVGALALYPSEMDASDLAVSLRKAGCEAKLSADAEGALLSLLAEMDPGSRQQLIEKIALSFAGQEGIDLQALEPHLPLAVDAAADALIDAVVDGRPEAVGPVLRRVTAGGVGAVAIMIQATRRFRDLVAVAGSGDGVEAALGRLRPPVFGPRRHQMAAAVRRWGPRSEEALRLLFATEGQLRRSGSRPDLAIVERCLLRLAMMGAQAARR